VKILSQVVAPPAGAWATVTSAVTSLRSSTLFRPGMMRALGVLGLFAVTGCGERPTADECMAFAEKFVQLVQEADDGAQGTDKLGAAMKTDVAKLCVQKGTKSDIACVMAATTLDEVDAKCR
jgi:hypothetical protein